MFKELFNFSCSYQDTDFTDFDTSKLITIKLEGALNLTLFFSLLLLQVDEHCQWVMETRRFQWVDYGTLILTWTVYTIQSQPCYPVPSFPKTYKKQKEPTDAS